MTLTIDGDIIKASGIPSSEVTEEKNYSFGVASCAQTELRGKGYKVTAFAIKGKISSAWGLRTESEKSLAVAAKLTPGVNTDIQFRLMVSKDTPAAYAPYANIRPIHGRTQVKVERCGENLLNIAPFTKLIKKGITYEYVANGGIHISGTATAAVDSPTFAIGHLPPGKYYGLNMDEDIAASIVVRRDGANLWLNAKGVFEIIAGDVIRYWYMIASNGVTLNKTVYPYIVPGTSAPATHTPYIGSTTTITLPSTIYGGEVGADGEGQETWGYIESYAGEVVPAGWICDRAVYAEGATPPTGAQVAYKLATPIPFTATGGGTIPTVKGTNTLFTDADTIKATYRCNVRAAEQEINALYTDLLNEVEE